MKISDHSEHLKWQSMIQVPVPGGRGRKSVDGSRGEGIAHQH